MEMDTKTEEIGEITLGDNSRFSYTIRQVEINNILGTAVAILNEYFVINSANEAYKLYRTIEGNWYDISGANPDGSTPILRILKNAIVNENSAKNQPI